MHRMIQELQDKLEKPTPAIEILRQALQTAQAGTGVAGLFTSDQLAYFAKHSDCIPGYLETENGKDALYLLCDSFKSYVEATCADSEGGNPD